MLKWSVRPRVKDFAVINFLSDSNTIPSVTKEIGLVLVVDF